MSQPRTERHNNPSAADRCHLLVKLQGCWQPLTRNDYEAVGVDIVFLAIFGEVNNPQRYCRVQTEPFRVDEEAGNFCQHSIYAKYMPT